MRWRERPHKIRGWEPTFLCRRFVPVLRPPDSKGEILQRLRGIIAALAVGAPLTAFLHLWLHAPIEFAAVISGVLGIAIFAIVATRSDAHEDAADKAWLEASPDLPPMSDRIALERDQVSMPGPVKPRAAGKRQKPNETASQGANLK
jgi:hypothetical protein